jgi:AcrR family transcriptional regulator
MARKLSPERKEKFMEAALKLFAEKGVQNASTAAIAKEAGSAAGTLFLYFPTKQDLVDELVLQISSENAASVKSNLSPDRSAHDTFWTIWQSYIRWFLEHEEAYRYIRQVMDSGLPVAEEVSQETAKNLDYFFAAIQKGLAGGAIKPYPAELIGGILYQDIVAVMNLIREQPDSAKQEEIIENGFDIFWNGIRSGQ